MKVVFVGAGVANCIAIRLLQKHLDSTDEILCLEQTHVDDQIYSGTGLNIGPNAVKSLGLYEPALRDAILAISYCWRSWRISLVDGRTLLELNLADVADNDGIRVRWSELYRVLRSGIDVCYGARLTHAGYEQHNPARTFVQYVRDGRSHRIGGIDLLVCGDGRYSVARTQLLGELETKHYGVAIGRLLVADTSNQQIDDYHQWFNGNNRLLAFKVPTDAVYICLTMPMSDQEAIPKHVKDPEFLRTLYAPNDRELSRPCDWVVEQITANAAAIHWARFQESPLSFDDKSGSVLFLGDAAHGMLPTLGQGATQAIEDGCVAGALLGRFRAEHRLENVSELISRFRELREDRIHFVNEFSREATDTLLAGSDPISGSLKKLEPEFQRKLRRLYCDVTMVDP